MRAPRWSIVTTMLLAISSAFVLIRYRVNSAWLVMGGGLIGLAMALWRFLACYKENIS